MGNKATVSAEFIAVDKSLGAKIDEISAKLDKLGKQGSGNFSANMIQSIDLVIKRVRQFGQELLDVAERGTSFSLLEEGFESLARSIDSNGQKIIKSLEETANNAISDRNLMLSANRAILLKVTDNEKQLNDLLEISINRANKLGLSATQAFDNIVTGLGRESALILDNLGIIIKIEEVTKKYADARNKTIVALTAEERKQALVNAVIEESKTLISSVKTEAELNAAKVAELNAAWQNLSDHLSSQAAPAMADIAQKIADAIERIDEFVSKTGTNYNSNFLNGLINQLKEIQDLDPNRVFNDKGKGFFDTGYDALLNDSVATKLRQLGIESATVSQLIAILSGELQTNSDSFKAAIDSATNFDNNMIRVTKSLSGYDAQQQAISQANQLFEERMKVASSAINYLAISTAQASSELGNFEARLLSVQRANSQFETGINSITSSIVSQAVAVQKLVGAETARNLANNALQQLNADTELLKENLQSGEVSALDLALTFGSIEDKLLSPFEGIQEQNRLAQAAIANTKKTIDQTAQKAQQAFDQLQSKVSSVLSSALDSGTGVNPDDILPRKDAVNEDARRLADIAVNGFNSPWYDYFKNEFPALFQQFFSGATTDNGIKLQAANLLRNFQDGLVPELIDKETAKDRVRRALIGEQNMQELAREIAEELSSEFGQSVSSVQSVANSVLGTGGNTLQFNAPQINTDSLAGFGDQFNDGVTQSLSDFSARFASFISDQLSAKVVLENVSNSGKQNGEKWGNGFLETVGDNVPLQLVELLSLLVLPNVQKQLNQADERELAR